MPGQRTNCFTFITVLITVALFSGTMQGQSPIINTHSDSSLDRSGRLRIFGTGFGVNQGSGQVMFDGIPAIVTTWTDTEIHAYVPESASTGNIPFQVVTTMGVSNTSTLEVTTRTSTGHVGWRFQLDSMRVAHRAGIGPDGSVYVLGVNGILYALSSSGGLQWVYNAQGGGDDGPVVVGADGTIYIAGNSLGPDAEIHALNPNGTVKWVFATGNTQGVIAGPGVGPDGNIYAVVDNAGAVGGSIGAFSLDPQGNLRWSNPGSPNINEHGQLGQEIAFSAGTMYVAFDQYGVSASTLFGFDLSSGNQVCAVTGMSDPAQPIMSPTGLIHVRTGTGAGSIGAFAGNGFVQWDATPPSPNNVLLNPVIGPDGTVYTVRNFNDLWAINPNGTTKWVMDHPGIQENLGVSPDGTVILSGGRINFGYSGWVQAYDLNGNLMWQDDFPAELEGAASYGSVVMSTKPIFTADSSRAYYGTDVLGPDPANPYSYLYAIDVVPNVPAPCVGDITPAGGNGTVNIDDLVMTLNSFGACPTPPLSCSADITPTSGNGVVNIDDLVMVLNAFGSCP